MLITLILLLALGCGGAARHIPPPALPAAQVKAQHSPPAKSLQHYALAVLAWESGEHDDAQEHLGIALLFDPHAAWLHQAKGLLALEQGELESARRSLIKAINLAPQQADARLALVRVLEIEGDYPAATRQLETLLQHQRSDRAFSDLIQLHLMQGQRDQAAAVLDSWAEQPPAHEGWLQSRAVLRLELDRPEQAWQDLAQLLEGDVAGGPALDLLIEATQQSRRYGSTIELLERVVTWEPGNEEMVVRLGGLAEQAGDHLTAADAWRHLDVLRGGRDAGVKLMLAQALLAAGDGSAALETARRAQELGEDPVLLAPVLARALAASGQLEAAIELVEAQQGWAADPSKLRLIAQLLEAEGRLQEARDRLRAALDVVPSSWTIAHALASLEARTGNLDGARALVERLPNPSDSEADRLLTEAQLTHESGQHELALTLLAGGEQRWPDASALPLTRVYWLMDSDPTAALAASRQAVARAPQDPGLVQQLALLEHRRGELERARSLLADALLANPDDPHLLNDLAYISAEGGDVSDPMLAMARRAVDQRPASGSFLDTLGWILVERGELDEAVVILERAARLAPDDPTISDHLVEARARGAASPPETR